ncbi:MAG TPA: class I SAM-dependent methyltransferase [Burkholderiales bacterium]|nr:class I SAM-dependent methyltransferase [Burkholderiales bacterium]
MKDPVVEEYAGAAKDYDRKWSFYVEATTRETLARLEMRPTDRVLDIGCGTGELLSRLAAKYPEARLSGLDPVPEMLEMARRKLSERVDLRVGWANELPWPDGTFDLVVSCNMFHYITHPVDAVREMERVLKPGGRIVITDWCDDYLACRVCNLYLRLMSKAHYKTYRQAECESLLEQAGAHPQIERYKISWLWGLMTATAGKPA